MIFLNDNIFLNRVKYVPREKIVGAELRRVGCSKRVTAVRGKEVIDCCGQVSDELVFCKRLGDREFAAGEDEEFC